MDKGTIIIYQSEDGQTRIEVKLQEETLWLTQAQICELYHTSRTNVVEHIKHIYEEGELSPESTCRNFRQVRQEGTRQVERLMPFYSLDMIISLGYRIKSIIATRFRQRTMGTRTMGTGCFVLFSSVFYFADDRLAVAEKPGKLAYRSTNR